MAQVPEYKMSDDVSDAIKNKKTNPLGISLFLLLLPLFPLSTRLRHSPAAHRKLRHLAPSLMLRLRCQLLLLKPILCSSPRILHTRQLCLVHFRQWLEPEGGAYGCDAKDGGLSGHVKDVC